MTINLNDYASFVDKCTSNQSKDLELLKAELDRLAQEGCNIARLDTAASGLLSESGEIMEIVKKLKFQGKNYNEDIRFHLIREAGDVIWYWANLCMALGIDPIEVIRENVNKLSTRYPEGHFTVFRSENRKAGDL